jgi:hypothetical protein
MSTVTWPVSGQTSQFIEMPRALGFSRALGTGRVGFGGRRISCLLIGSTERRRQRWDPCKKHTPVRLQRRGMTRFTANLAAHMHRVVSESVPLSASTEAVREHPRASEFSLLCLMQPFCPRGALPDRSATPEREKKKDYSPMLAAALFLKRVPSRT